jgi:hypothetical protein
MRIMGAVFLALFAIFMGGCSLLFLWDSEMEGILAYSFLFVAVLLGWLAWRIGTDQVGTPIKKGSQSADPDLPPKDQDGDADP